MSYQDPRVMGFDPLKYLANELPKRTKLEAHIAELEKQDAQIIKEKAQAPLDLQKKEEKVKSPMFTTKYSVIRYLKTLGFDKKQVEVFKTGAIHIIIAKDKELKNYKVGNYYEFISEEDVYNMLQDDGMLPSQQIEDPEETKDEATEDLSEI